jgi:thymidine kinase
VSGSAAAGAAWPWGPPSGRLRFYLGVMGSGKSALALQVAHHRKRAGRPGMLMTNADRGGAGRLSSRLGISSDAVEFDPGTDFGRLLPERIPVRGFVICDEAQFLTERQVDDLAACVDDLALDVDCFGLATAFDSRLFPGSKRLLELADETVPLQVEVLCWCGEPGRINARLENGTVARAGGQVAVGDVLPDGSGATYRVLCRRHWRSGDPGPGLDDVPLLGL